MKKIIWMLPFVIVLTQCKSNEKKSKNKITERDYSVTKSNAYNDLFLDSMDLVSYLQENEIPQDTADRMTGFYNARNYQFAWFSSNGLSEQAMGFASLLNLSSDTSKDVKKLQKDINQFLGSSNPNIKPTKKIVQHELLLTQNLIEYVQNHYEDGVITQRELERFVPFMKRDPLQIADSILDKKNKDDAAYMMVNEPYKQLISALVKYNSLAKGTEWQQLDVKARYRKGKADPGLRKVKTNLFLAGDMGLDTTEMFNDSLEAGIKNFQKRIGQKQDGKIDQSVLNMLNIQPREMVERILINLNRMRWLPQQYPGKLLMVNIPDFTLSVEENGNLIKQMPVVVGQEGHNTVLFSDKMTTIVFSPYWNIPPSIVRNEILPAMENDPTYLERNEMEIYGEEGGLPAIRQRPGAKNSLGKVKFLFPNSFNIYFHDTPVKWLFNQDERASSHGCIRLGEPFWLASWLLKNDSKWTEEKIKAAMDRGTEQYVTLKDPASVIITYYTAWVNDDGLNIRKDIYGHDADVMKKMFK